MAVLNGALDDDLRAYVEAQETMVVATYDDNGDRECVCRVGAPGFVRVLGIDRIAWPEYAADAPLRCDAQHPEVTLMFVNPAGTTIGLHLDGQAKILDDKAMRRAYRGIEPAAYGPRPDRWVTVFIEAVHAPLGA